MTATTTRNRSTPAQPRETSAESGVVASSGNVFADIGLASARVDQMKLKVAVAINAALRAYGGNQARRAEILGLDQSTMSLLENYELSRFTLDRLCRYAFALSLPLNVELGGEAEVA